MERAWPRIMVEVGSASGVYEERYAWSRRTTSVVIGGVLAVAVSAGVAMPLLPAMVLFGAGLLAVAWGLLSRRVALRVDAAGVTLGGSPLRYRGTTVLVAWTDIMTVVLWQQVRLDGALVQYLGLQRRPGTAPLPEPARRRGRDTAAGLAPALPAEVIMASRAVTGWRLNRRDLARAVAGFAPETRVLDHDTGQVIPGNRD